MFVISLDRGVREQLGPARRHGFVDESIDDTGADQGGKCGFRLPISRDHDDEVRKLPFDLPDEHGRAFGERLHVENQDAHFAGEQKIADLVARRDVPQAPRAADGFAQGLQEYLVGGQNHEFDDVARETEPQRIQRAAFFIRS